jgi:hypothetical protein
MRQVALALPFAAVLLFAASLVAAQQTSNYELRLVPCPGPVKIDGKLGDWDLSGGLLMCYDLATMRDNHSVQVYGMYDADALYLAFHFKDKTPLVNHLDPKLEPFNGWRSDCVQMRIWTDQVLHVDAYYWTDEKQPVVQITYKDMGIPNSPQHDIPDALAAGAQEAFQMDADQQGYVQEVRLPWKLLRQDGHAYQAGQSFHLGFECFWGDVTGRNWPEHRLVDLINPDNPQREFFWSNKNAWGTATLMKQGHLQPAPTPAELTPAQRLAALRTKTQGPVPLEYTLPADSFVTLVIEDAAGRRLRNLIANAPRKAGKNTDYWDGADDSGQLVAPGNYRFRGLFHKGLDLAYQFYFNNPGNPPWDTGDGHGNWLADHTNPQAAAADAEAVYVAAPNAEAGASVMRLDLEGRKQWGVIRVMPAASTALAVDDQFVYVALDRQGYALIKGKDNQDGEIILYKVDKRTGRFAGWPDNQREHSILVWPLSKVPTGPNFVWPPPPDLTLPDLRRTGGMTPAAMRQQLFGMAVDDKNCYLPAYYLDQVLVVDKAAGTLTKTLSVPRPAGLALTPDRHLLAVSGTQVLSLDPATGDNRPLITTDLQAPVALSVDKQGNIYVSDWAGAMQVKVFSPQGKLLRTVGKPGGRAWIGAFAQSGLLMPRGLAVDAQSRLWVAEDDVSPKRISLWGADGQFQRDFIGPTGYGGMYGCLNAYNPSQALNYGCEWALDWKTGAGKCLGTLWRQLYDDALFGIDPYDRIWVIRSKGKEYVISDNGRDRFVISIRDGDYYRPLAAVGYNPPQAPFLPQPNQNDNFVWSDRNGDGRVQADEYQVFPAPGVDKPMSWYSGWTWAVDDNLTIYPASTGGATYLWKMPVTGWTPCGAPLYDGPHAQLIVNQRVAWFCNSLKCDGAGNILADQSPLTSYSPAGEIRWTYPNQWPGVHGSHRSPQAQPGRLIGPLYVTGQGELDRDRGEVFAMIGNMGQVFLMTADGLYIGELFQDVRSAPQSLPATVTRGMSLNKTSCGSEPFGGFFLKNPTDGKFYVVAGHSAAVIHEVKGLDSLTRLAGGRCPFSLDQYRQAEQLLAKRAAEAALPPVKIVRAETPPPLRGDLRGWQWAEGTYADFSFDPAHTCRAAARYDDQNLYLAYQVRDDSPWKNATQDPKLAFKGGDCVVFEIGADPKAPAGRGEAVAGDKRLLIAPVGGKATAILYDYVVPGTAQPETFSSPSQHTRVDRVILIPDARLEVKTTPDGYTLEAAIPLSALRWTPQPGETLHGDFGVIYSDPAGQVDVLRMYWANRAAGIVSDIGIEARIQPNLWGVMQVE